MPTEPAAEQQPAQERAFVCALRSYASGERHFAEIVEGGLVRTVEIRVAGQYDDGSVRWKQVTGGK